MFGKRSEASVHHHEITTARGGVLFGSIITGVLVAFGAMFLLSALTAGVLAATGYLDEVGTGTVLEVSLGAGIAFVLAQFLAYLWGGYTAGRMSRGAGVANGLLVPLAAILLALAVWAIAAVLGATANLNLPFTAQRLPIDTDLLLEYGPAVGIASLIAMFLGGALGGAMGAHWHTKLERHAIEEARSDVRSDTAQTTTTRTTPVTSPAAAPAVPRSAGTAPATAPPGTGATTTIRTEDGRPVAVGSNDGSSTQTLDVTDKERTTWA